MESSQYIFVVSGVVQCVGFRYHTSRQAQAMGLSGYAKNLNDGRVEVLAVGAQFLAPSNNILNLKLICYQTLILLRARFTGLSRQLLFMH